MKCENPKGCDNEIPAARIEAFPTTRTCCKACAAVLKQHHRAEATKRMRQRRARERQEAKT